MKYGRHRAAFWHTCFYTQRKDFTQKREKWLLKPNAAPQPRPEAGAKRRL